MEWIVIGLIALAAVKWFDGQNRRGKSRGALSQGSRVVGDWQRRYGGGARHYTAGNTFRVVSGLLTPTELAFYQSLRRATPAHVAIMWKVRVADVVNSANDNWTPYSYRQQHFDFVVCDPVTTKPMLAVELDDKSHIGIKAQKLDALKDAVCRSAGFPLLRVPTQSSYNTDYLRQRMEETINTCARH